MKMKTVIWMAALFCFLSTGCGKLIPLPSKPTSTHTPLPVTSTWTPAPLDPASIQTPMPGRIEVIFATAKDSPSKVWYEVYDSSEIKIFQGGEWENILYLPPGSYRYKAMAPIPTQPLGCYVVIADYGYFKDEVFSVRNQPIRIELKMGMIIEYCTSTPTP